MTVKGVAGIVFIVAALCFSMYHLFKTVYEDFEAKNV